MGPGGETWWKEGLDISTCISTCHTAGCTPYLEVTAAAVGSICIQVVVV